jgi:hypothetical protein
MKFTIFLIISILLFVANTFSQNTCPTIFVVGPKIPTVIGDSMNFTVKVDETDLSKIKFEWVVSLGAISSGQGTHSIIVATNEDMAGNSVLATVKISGLPQDCPYEAYGHGEGKTKNFNQSSTLVKNNWINISWLEEKERLDRLANNINLDDEARTYFLIETKQSNYLQTLKAKKTKIKNYLFEKHKIAKNRIWVVYSKNEVETVRGNYYSYTLFVSVPKLYSKENPKSKQK